MGSMARALRHSRSDAERVRPTLVALAIVAAVLLSLLAIRHPTVPPPPVGHSLMSPARPWPSFLPQPQPVEGERLIPDGVTRS
jgi:hypothetical protein